VIYEGDVAGFRRDLPLHRGIFGRAGTDDDVDEAIVDHDRRNGDASSQFTLAFRKQGVIDQQPSLDAFDSFGGDLLRELVDDEKRIAGQSLTVRAAVRMVFIFEGKGAIGLDAIGEVGVSAGDEHQIALQHAIFLNGSGAVDRGVKTIVRT
jgi:hypothetical protein